MEMVPISGDGINKMLAHGIKCVGDIYAVPEMVIEAPIFTRSNMGGIHSIGAFSYISGPGIHNDVSFGRYCSIATNVNIGFGEHPTDWLSTSPVQWSGFFPTHALPSYEPFDARAMVQVGHDVWIGHSTYIRAGVTIGNGAIIGACSVVTRDVPDYAVVVGNPGRIKRYRFDEKAIERLQRIAWWQYNIKDLYGCPFHDIDRALDWLEERQAAGALSPYVPEKYGAERLKAILAQD